MRILSLLFSITMEKKSKITIQEASRQLSYFKVTPVPLGTGITMIRSESEVAGNLFNLLGILFPETIMDSALTKKI